MKKQFPTIVRLVFLFLVLSLGSFLSAGVAPRAPQADEVTGPQGPPFAPSRPLVVQGGILIDGTGSAPRHDQAVVIEGERITWTGPMEEVQTPDGAEVLDASGMTIMPGLINSNCHVNIRALYPSPFANMTLEEFKARWEKTWSMMPKQAFVFLMQGITSMRNTSGPFKRLLPIKHAIEKGELPGPRIFLGGALLMSEEHFHYNTEVRTQTPPDALDWFRNEFAFYVVDDVDKDTDIFLSDDFLYWKLLMSPEPYDGKNDFTDEELRFIIDKAHRAGKTVNCHVGASHARRNEALRRMAAFDIDTLEHPFYDHFLVNQDIIEAYAKKGVFAASLLTVQVIEALRSEDPHRFSETIYPMSLEPEDYRVLLSYRDRMSWNKAHPDEPALTIYGAGTGGRSYNELQKSKEIARENMRRFIKAGVKMFMGTDTPSFLNFQQEAPDANEMTYMVEMGLTPMEAIVASTRNGAEALGMLDELGTVEVGKLADVIVVAGNPLLDMNAMKRVGYVIKGGVRYK